MTLHRRATLLAFFLALPLAGCSSDSKDSSGGNDEASDSIAISTESFTVQGGEERYVCYTETLQEDVTIDRFNYESKEVVHHFLLAQTLAPEPDGMWDCNDVLLKFTWLPLFGAGKGDAELTMPDDTAVFLPKGTQVLVQLHLLNITPDPVTESATVRMHQSDQEGLRQAGIYAFGSDDIELPPQQSSSVVDECVMDEPVEVFGLLAHMHYLGDSMTLEVGPSESEMQEVYRKSNWDFDAQIIEPVPLTLQPGDHTRVTCNYDNITNDVVGFGEGSADEMCFLVAFAKDRTSLDGCLTFSSDDPTEVPIDPNAPECGEQVANSLGIGAECTKGGGECASGQQCSADQGQTPDGVPGFCLKIGCNTEAECGGGGVRCCAPAEGGGLINICTPESCRPTNCIPVD